MKRTKKVNDWQLTNHGLEIIKKQIIYLKNEKNEWEVEGKSYAAKSYAAIDTNNKFVILYEQITSAKIEIPKKYINTNARNNTELLYHIIDHEDAQCIICAEQNIASILEYDENHYIYCSKCKNSFNFKQENGKIFISYQFDENTITYNKQFDECEIAYANGAIKTLPLNGNIDDLVELILRIKNFVIYS